MSSLNILISGSGIVGSVFAFWLLRAYTNNDIIIVERAFSPRLTGASVDIRSAAVDTIQWMGAGQEICNLTTNEEELPKPTTAVRSCLVTLATQHPALALVSQSVAATSFAGELLNHASNVKTALERYDGIVLPFVEYSEGGDNGMQLLNLQRLWGSRIRNAIMGFVTWTMLDPLVIAVASALGSTEKKVPIPHYQSPAK